MVSWVNAFGVTIEATIKCARCGSELVEVDKGPCTSPREDIAAIDGHPHVRCPTGHGTTVCFTLGCDTKPQTVH